MKLAVNQATLMKTPMESILKAISEAGFEGVELRRDETFQYLENHSVSELKTLLEDNNLECITFNAVELFSLCSENEFRKIYVYTERLMEIGTQIGCDTIITVPSFLEGLTMSDDQIAEKTVNRLKRLADLADKHSFKLGFEPLGFPNNSVRKLDLALKIINSEQLPSMGLIIDTFHYFVGENPLDDLEKIPLDQLWLVHINDAIEKPFNQLQDSHRVLPCQGFFNLEMFITKLREIGYERWLSLELFNEDLWTQDPLKVSKEAMNSLKSLL